MAASRQGGHRRIRQDVLPDLRHTGSGGGSGGAATNRQGLIPRDLNALQISFLVTGLGDGTHRFLGILFGQSDPGHQMATSFDHQPTDLGQQLRLTVDPNQGQVAFAEQAERAVEARLFALSLFLFGDVAEDFDRTDHLSRGIPQWRYLGKEPSPLRRVQGLAKDFRHQHLSLATEVGIMRQQRRIVLKDQIHQLRSCLAIEGNGVGVIALTEHR